MNIAKGCMGAAAIARRGSQVLKVKSPHILIAVGITAGIGAIVAAVKQSPKCAAVKEELEQVKRDAATCLEKGETVVMTKETATVVPYTEADMKKDLRIAYTHAVWGYTKVFAVPVVLETTSIACILTGHHIMMKRNAALTAAVTTVSEAFRRYRENVRAEYGDEVDYKMRHGIKAVNEVAVDPETGEVIKTENGPTKVDVPWRSNYAKLFTEGCDGFTRDPSANRCVLKARQAYANHLLQSQGYLFLNDIYKMLGIDETKAGSEMGWIYTKNPADNQYGDGYVDFGFEKNWDLIRETGTDGIWLDFNVDDAPIRDRIKWAVY